MSLHFRYEQLGNFLQDRHILVMGVRNRWSLARHIAEQAVWHGATIHYTYLGEKDLRALKRLTGEPEGTHFFPVRCEFRCRHCADVCRTQRKSRYPAWCCP
jgi:enoyl-[acyl-carrier-protein] reductase (NADH)